MNCDQAFDCLTDSDLRHSPQLEEHLARCARCRQMQETLEPALDLFDELVPEPDLSGRVFGTQTLAPESVRVAEQAASRLAPAGTGSHVKRRSGVVRYAAAAMVGAALMGVMGTINNAHSPVDSSTQCTWRSRVIDRDSYPSNVEFARSCVVCHLHEASPIDARTEPISTEIPADLSAAVDSLIRQFCERDQWSLNTAIAIAPGFEHAVSGTRLCAVSAVLPRGGQIA
jgi:hypothetical protein